MPNDNKPSEAPKQPQPNPNPNEPTANDIDTAPDETVGADADTDTPIDREVVNDAVLRGEDRPDDTPKPTEETKPEGPAKMNTGEK